MIKITLSFESSAHTETDLLVFPLRTFASQASVSSLDKALKGELTNFVKAETFTAKRGQRLALPTFGALPARRLLLLGLGEQGLSEREDWLRLGAQIAKAAAASPCASLAIALEADDATENALFGLSLGLHLGAYRFDKYKSDAKPLALQDARILVPQKTAPPKASSILAYTAVLAQGISSARDLVNEPPRILTPTDFARRAQEMAEELGLLSTIFDDKALLKEGMRMLLSVGEGSDQESRLIHLVYRPASLKGKPKRVLALVGKGITFDSGGLCLKPSASMIGMHCDMAGGAAVFGAMQILGLLKPNLDFEVHGYIAAAENMTGGSAFKLNDVVVAHNKKTVEILNTDAEGRLVLGDTLSYACQEGATEIIDLATLTGACMVALGRSIAGIMGNHPPLLDSLQSVAKSVGESLWPLPMTEEIRDTLKSSVADLANVGDRYAGASIGGLFLREFVREGVTWAHLDIAGPAWTEKEKDHLPKGGTGFGVATLVAYIMASSPDGPYPPTPAAPPKSKAAASPPKSKAAASPPKSKAKPEAKPATEAPSSKKPKDAASSKDKPTPPKKK